MRRLGLIVLVLGLVGGCASTREVPLPATTPYDSNPKARKAYLEGYRMGYRNGIKGGGGSFDSFDYGQTSEARNFGWFYGQMAGQEAGNHRH